MLKEKILEIFLFFNFEKFEDFHSLIGRIKGKG